MPFSPPRDLPSLAIEPRSPALQASEPPNNHLCHQGSPTQRVISRNSGLNNQDFKRNHYLFSEKMLFHNFLGIFTKKFPIIKLLCEASIIRELLLQVQGRKSWGTQGINSIWRWAAWQE